MGVGLNRQVTREFDGKPTLITMFKGSEGVDNPDTMFEPADKAPIQDQKTNKEALKNKRAQYYFELRKRIYRTFRAISMNEYHDPDGLISFDSRIKLLPKLRSELCRMPVKPNGAGLFELYRKDEMKTRFKFESPNLGDSVMMLMRTPHQPNIAKSVMPPPIRPMGRRPGVRA
jgi:phage terminase large subunit